MYPTGCAWHLRLRHTLYAFSVLGLESILLLLQYCYERTNYCDAKETKNKYAAAWFILKQNLKNIKLTAAIHCNCYMKQINFYFLILSTVT